MSDIVGEWVPVGDLVPWDQNPRDNDQSVDEVAGSIRRFGFAAPIIARRADSMVIAGHTRLKAAQRLGINKVPVRWMDLDPSEARMLALADNKLNERADWDDELLSGVLAQLQEDGADLEGLGWDDEEIDALIADAGPEVELPEDIEPAEPPREPDSKPGEVYELGPHRLVCGDSTDPKTWTALLGDEVLDMVWTDPPYGVSYVGGTKDAMTIENDDLTEEQLRVFLDSAFDRMLEASKPGAVWYVAAPAGPLFLVFASLLHARKIWRHTLVWLKDRFVMGRCDYHYRHEAVFYGWTPKGAHYFVDDRTQDSVHEVPRPGVSKEHPTMKPVDLVARHIENSSKPGWLIGDAFGGSGTTLLAAARTGRIARLVELDPRFCDVIRDRWTRWATEAGVDPGPGALLLERD